MGDSNKSQKDKYVCPSCGSEEVWRGKWPDYQAYSSNPDESDAPLCVEFECGTRKLIDGDTEVLDEFGVKDRLEKGYFDQTDKCEKEQKRRSVIVMAELSESLRMSELTYDDIEQIREVIRKRKEQIYNRV